jgi:hypothetical protein
MFNAERLTPEPYWGFSPLSVSSRISEGKANEQNLLTGETFNEECLMLYSCLLFPPLTAHREISEVKAVAQKVR